MTYTEDDAEDLTNEIITIIDNYNVSTNKNRDTRKLEVVNKTKRKILQLIRRKLKLTRDYKTLEKTKSSIYGFIEIEEEHYIESPQNLHKGFRLIFGEAQTEDDEKHNIKLLTVKEIKWLIEYLFQATMNCKHDKEKDWKKVDMGIDESGDFRWIHYICPCGYLQKVEIT